MDPNATVLDRVLFPSVIRVDLSASDQSVRSPGWRYGYLIGAVVAKVLGLSRPYFFEIRLFSRIEGVFFKGFKGFSKVFGTLFFN